MKKILGISAVVTLMLIITVTTEYYHFAPGTDVPFII
jgi:hypothetical protein